MGARIPLGLAAATIVMMACAGAVTMVPAAPPNGVSLAENVDAGAEPLAEAPLVSREAGAGDDGKDDESSSWIKRVSSCLVPPVPASDAGASELHLTELLDVSFGPDKRERYDLAAPVGHAKNLLVVMVHGGGWTSGRKSLFRPTIRTFAELGYVAASIEYRLAADAHRAFPAGLADVRCGLRAVQARARAMGVTRTVVIGASSGGHLAAMLAVAGDAKGFDGECSARGPVHVDGAVLYYAPVELDRARERYPPRMVQAVDELFRGVSSVAADREGTSAAATAAWNAHARAATPRHYIDAADPPILVIHGEADNIVPIQDARDFHEALVAAHVPTLLVEVPEQKHGFPVLGRSPSLQPASCTTLRFLEHLAGAR